MRLYKVILIIAILFLLPSYSYSSGLGSLRVSLIQGDVQLRTDTAYGWLSVSLNMPLREGDTLWVPESGRVEIQMDDGSILRLGENSSLEIVRVSGNLLWFELTEGRAYVNFSGWRDNTIQIDIPPFSNLRAYDRSKFSIDLRNYRYAEVSVFKGVVYADVRGDMTGIYAGQSLSIGLDMYADVSTLGPSDEWELWNRERDRRFERSWYSYRYLPDELKVYAYEFDTNGRWVYTVRYGYVWVPTVYITTRWAPYRVGRWVWIGNEYVWVSEEPWGWVPYHYGRWAFSISIGWFWVPPARGAVYWGPGFVGWIQTPTYIAWIPLAPEDIYYGYGYYGPRSVNIIHIDIHKTVIKNVYKNVYIDNAVTVVYRDSFIKGRYVPLKTDKSLFVREIIRPGRTKMVSDRMSLLPITEKLAVRNRHAPRINKETDLIKHDKRKVITRRRIDHIRKQTIDRGSIYPKEIRRGTIKNQRREVKNYPETRTLKRERRNGRSEISKESVRRGLSHKRYLIKRQSSTKGRFYIAEKRYRDDLERPRIEKNKRRNTGKVSKVIKEGDRYKASAIRRWMRR